VLKRQGKPRAGHPGYSVSGGCGSKWFWGGGGVVFLGVVFLGWGGGFHESPDSCKKVGERA